MVVEKGQGFDGRAQGGNRASGRQARTATVENSLDPVWNETHAFLLGREVTEFQINILDEDPGCNDVMAKVRVRVDRPKKDVNVEIPKRVSAVTALSVLGSGLWALGCECVVNRFVYCLCVRPSCLDETSMGRDHSTFPTSCTTCRKWSSSYPFWPKTQWNPCPTQTSWATGPSF